MAASGVGSLLAALWLAFGDGTRIRRIGYGALILGIGEIALGASRSFPVSLLLMVGVGFGGILMATTANTTMQLAVPDGLRGRVMSVYTTVFAGSTPIGGPVMGGLASVFGVAVSLAVGGVLSALVGAGALVWMRRNGLDRGVLRPPRGGSGAGAGCGPCRGRCPERSAAGSRPASLIGPLAWGVLMPDLAAPCADRTP